MDCEPPRAVPPARKAAPLLEPSAIGRLEPSRATEDAAPARLVVENRSTARVLMIVQGVPVAWVDAASTLSIDGFAPGSYTARVTVTVPPALPLI